MRYAVVTLELNSYSQLINYFATDDPGHWWAIWCDPELLARFALELRPYDLTRDRLAALTDLTNLYHCWSAPMRIYIGGSCYSPSDLNNKWLWRYWKFGKG